MNRIAPQEHLGPSTHSSVIGWANDLIIELKLLIEYGAKRLPPKQRYELWWSTYREQLTKCIYAGPLIHAMPSEGNHQAAILWMDLVCRYAADGAVQKLVDLFERENDWITNVEACRERAVFY